MVGTLDVVLVQFTLQLHRPFPISHVSQLGLFSLRLCVQQHQVVHCRFVFIPRRRPSWTDDLPQLASRFQLPCVVGRRSLLLQVILVSWLLSQVGHARGLLLRSDFPPARVKLAEMVKVAHPNHVSLLRRDVLEDHLTIFFLHFLPSALSFLL